MMTTTDEGPTLAEAIANLNATVDRHADLRARHAGATCENHPDRPATWVVSPGFARDRVLCDSCHDSVADASGSHVSIDR